LAGRFQENEKVAAMTKLEVKGNQSLIAFLVFAGATVFVYIVSGIVTATSVSSWYQTLNKPSFNPPDWIFAPVWSVLFIMIAIAGSMAWRRAKFYQRRRVLLVFSTQLALNCLWSVLFFGLQWVGTALIEIIFLWASILWAMYVFWPIDRRASILFAPYASWVTFAIALNAAIWSLN
jgi:benzodiazapine receptor